MSFPFVLEQIVNGLLVGTYYLLIALGLSLIFSLGGIVNLAHGAFYAIGAYFAVEIAAVPRLRRRSSSRRCCVALLGIVLERFLFRRFYRADPILGLLLTFGLAMVIEQVLRIDLGHARLPFPIPDFLGASCWSATSSIRYYRLTILAVTVLAVPGLWLLFSRTAFGRVVRAGVQNPDMVARARHLAGARHDGGGRARHRAGRTGRRAARRRSPASIRPWGRRSSPPHSWSSSSAAWAASGASWSPRCWSAWSRAAIHFSPPAAEASMYLLMILVLLFRPRGLIGERFERFE